MSALTPIYTIGYGNRLLVEFLETLRQHEIACLVDIRTAPYSRFRPEFSREALEALLKEQEVRYVYLGRELGGRPDDPECYVDGKVEYEHVKERAAYRKGIERLQRAQSQGMRMVLMCSEGRAEECHRSKLVAPSLGELAIPVLHLEPDGSVITQDEVLRELTGGQLNLFGDPAFTSRKRYPGES